MYKIIRFYAEFGAQLRFQRKNFLWNIGCELMIKLFERPFKPNSGYK